MVASVARTSTSAPHNVEAAYRFLRRKGLGSVQAAGIIGSMQGESGKNLDPGAVNPNGGATGIAQWLGGRKTAAVMTKQLKPQLEHLWHELQGPERGALGPLKAAKTPEQAAIAWQKYFERGAPFEQKYNMRASNARQVFKQLGNVDLGALPSGGGLSKGTPGTPGTSTVSFKGSVTPSMPVPDRRAAVAQVLRAGASHGLPKLGTSRLKQADYLFRSGMATAPSDTTSTSKLTITDTPGTPGTKGSSSASAASAGGGGALGKIQIFNGNPGRLQGGVKRFAEEVAGIAGRTLRIDSGATHSKFTVNGNVSDHWSGHATDIPASGEALTKLGRDALVAAGWSRKRANAVKGGLFNVVDKQGRKHQIIFNTMEGGNHYTHLHISSRG